LTVLFCDLVNSIEIAAHLDPEEWHDIAAQYQRSAGEAVVRLGGHVAKYLGDGLVVYFGYPQAHEDDAERAVRAGLAIVDAVAALNNRLAGEHSVGLAVRIGIDTGSVVSNSQCKALLQLRARKRAGAMEPTGHADRLELPDCCNQQRTGALGIARHGAPRVHQRLVKVSDRAQWSRALLFEHDA